MSDPKPLSREQKLERALRMVLGSTLLEADGHDWFRCGEVSCTLAREALGLDNRVIAQKGDS
jgi:hypothetical protein